MELGWVLLTLDLGQILLRDRDHRTEELLAIEPDSFVRFRFDALERKSEQTVRLRLQVE